VSFGEGRPKQPFQSVPCKSSQVVGPANITMRMSPVWFRFQWMPQFAAMHLRRSVDISRGAEVRGSHVSCPLSMSQSISHDDSQLRFAQDGMRAPRCPASTGLCCQRSAGSALSLFQHTLTARSSIRRIAESWLRPAALVQSDKTLAALGAGVLAVACGFRAGYLVHLSHLMCLKLGCTH
jgi:hypothetical protein